MLYGPDFQLIFWIMLAGGGIQLSFWLLARWRADLDWWKIFPLVIFMIYPGFLLYVLLEDADKLILGIVLGIITSLSLTWYGIGYLYEIEGWPRPVLTIITPTIVAVTHPLAYWLEELVLSALF